jgi:dipeptidase
MPENTQGSTAVPEATAVATVVPDEGVVEQLVSMGFSTNGWGLP